MFLRPGRNLPPLFFPSSTKAHTYRIFRHSQRKSIKKGRKEIFPPCPQGQIKNSSKSWVEKGGGVRPVCRREKKVNIPPISPLIYGMWTTSFVGFKRNFRFVLGLLTHSKWNHDS